MVWFQISFLKLRSERLKAAAKLRAVQAVRACPEGVKCGVGVLVCADLSSQVMQGSFFVDGPQSVWQCKNHDFSPVPLVNFGGPTPGPNASNLSLIHI